MNTIKHGTPVLCKTIMLDPQTLWPQIHFLPLKIYAETRMNAYQVYIKCISSPKSSTYMRHNHIVYTSAALFKSKLV